MPTRWHSSVILVVVFALGLAAGIAGMVWAWPGLRARFHRHETATQYMTRVAGLSSAQGAQVQAAFADYRTQRHVIHEKFVPDYEKVCQDFTATTRQEHDLLDPAWQATLQKVQSLMTPAQWAKLQQDQQKQSQAHHNPPRRQPDLCRHLPSSGASGTPNPSGGNAHRR